ncbi:hypothetical protein NDU88_005057 [Pleurodeles waltl]|uniref:Uncharacterized protein n=1 Tax=Pleurodeles waltl TaxID=8319 RepID=A0AAV7MVM4_PLEWA|nr:hypothetical protein NDU88_005057 [Pleurodeles waltl]
MPPSKASAGKRKERDPELSRLLKMVLEKLGNDDTDSSDVASDNEDNGAKSSRPRQSHVAPRAVFLPVKRRNKGKAPASAPPMQASILGVSPLEQVAVPEIPVPAVCAQPELQGKREGATMSMGLGVAEVLANVRKSLASLAPATVPGVLPTPLPGVPTPAALTLAPPTPQVPTQQTQVQDPSRQALLEVSRLLASINGQASNPPAYSSLEFKRFFAKFFNGAEMRWRQHTAQTHRRRHRIAQLSPDTEHCEYCNPFSYKCVAR